MVWLRFGHLCPPMDKFTVTFSLRLCPGSGATTVTLVTSGLTCVTSKRKSSVSSSQRMYILLRWLFVLSHVIAWLSICGSKMMDFFCPQKFVFFSQNAFFAQTPSFFAQTPSFFAHKSYQRVFFTQKRLQLFGHIPDVPSTPARPPPPGPPPPPPPPGQARPPRPAAARSTLPLPPAPTVSARLATDSTAPVRRLTPCTRVRTTCWALQR